jgi:TolB-like protein
MRVFALSAVLAATMTGCADIHVPTRPPTTGRTERAERITDLVTLHQKVADALLEGAALDRDKPLLVAAFVNMDDMTASSRLGRLSSEQVSSGITRRGWRVIELKLREKLFMKKGQGALLLSTELNEISQSHQAQAVVVGSYTYSGEMLYMSVKLVGIAGNVILAAHDYAIPLDRNVRELLV